MTISLDRRALLAGAGAGVLALGAGATSRAQAQAQRLLAIATGTTGGVYFPLGGGMASIFSRVIPGLSATAEVTGGSIANLQLLGADRVALALTQVDAAMDAVAGRERFAGRPVPARAMLVMYTNRMQVVTTAATGITRMADLRGRRISTGAPGSATEVMALRLIAAAGLDHERDFRARERLSPAESTNAIRDGKLDAYFFVSGVPTAAITDLGATPGVELRLIDHDEFLPAIVARYGPVYFAEEIPAGTYPDQTAPNRQISVANIVAVREDMPGALLTELLTALWENLAELHRVHAEARNIRLENQRSAAAGIPWHPAAEAFWKARGATLG